MITNQQHHEVWRSTCLPPNHNTIPETAVMNGRQHNIRSAGKQVQPATAPEDIFPLRSGAAQNHTSANDPLSHKSISRTEFLSNDSPNVSPLAIVIPGRDLLIPKHTTKSGERNRPKSARP